jgi:hypothetical protein
LQGQPPEGPNASAVKASFQEVPLQAPGPNAEGAHSLQGTPLLFFLTLGSPSAHPNSGATVVARAQGGLTLGPEGGELGADFCQFGIREALQSMPT